MLPWRLYILKYPIRSLYDKWFFLYFSSMWCFAWMPPQVFFSCRNLMIENVMPQDWSFQSIFLIKTQVLSPFVFDFWKVVLNLFNIKYRFFLHSGCFYFSEDLIICMVHTFCLFSLSTPLFLLFKCLFSCLICISLFSPLYSLSNSLSRYIQTLQFVLISKVFFYSVSVLRFNRSYITFSSISIYFHVLLCFATLLNLLHVLL